MSFLARAPDVIVRLALATASVAVASQTAALTFSTHDEVISCSPSRASPLSPRPQWMVAAFEASGLPAQEQTSGGLGWSWQEPLATRTFIIVREGGHLVLLACISALGLLGVWMMPKGFSRILAASSIICLLGTTLTFFASLQTPDGLEGLIRALMTIVVGFCAQVFVATVPIIYGFGMTLCRLANRLLLRRSQTDPSSQIDAVASPERKVSHAHAPSPASSALLVSIGLTRVHRAKHAAHVCRLIG